MPLKLIIIQVILDLVSQIRWFDGEWTSECKKEAFRYNIFCKSQETQSVEREMNKIEWQYYLLLNNNKLLSFNSMVCIFWRLYMILLKQQLPFVDSIKSLELYQCTIFIDSSNDFFKSIIFLFVHDSWLIFSIFSFNKCFCWKK